MGGARAPPPPLATLLEALKLDHCDQEILCFGLIGFRHLHRK